jgi:D-3-phosphoglycerate dehydrogenase
MEGFWTMAKVVLVGVPGMNDQEIVKIEGFIKSEAPGVDYEFLGNDVLSDDDLVHKAGDADIIVTWNQQMSDELYGKLNLKAFCCASTGFDAADVKSATKHGVMVTNAKDYCVDEVSAHAVMFLLTMARKLWHVSENAKKDRWSVDGIGNVKRLKDSTVGIFAFGSIARAVAEKLNGFGVKMISYDPYVDEEIMESYGVEKVEFQKLLKESDYITIHAPLTEETQGIFSKEALAMIKPSAYIINTARGRIIDQEALYEALVKGSLAGAGLDVLWNEPPLEMDNKLFELPNVIITPHSAFFSDEAQEQQLRITAKDVGRILRGEKPVNLRN